MAQVLGGLDLFVAGSKQVGRTQQLLAGACARGGGGAGHGAAVLGGRDGRAAGHAASEHGRGHPHRYIGVAAERPAGDPARAVRLRLTQALHLLAEQLDEAARLAASRD